MKKNIVLIGGRGVVGSSIYKYLNLNYKINICSRNDKFDKFLDNAEIIIHTANSSKKFEAIKNPNRDYKESILKTKKIASKFKQKKIILISTISARIENNNYGINRKECEDIILNTNRNNFIIRLPVIYSDMHNRGIIYDLIHSNKIYIDKKSKLNPIHIDQFSLYLSNNLEKKGIIEFGSAQDIELSELLKLTDSKSIAKGSRIDLITLKNKEDLPDLNIFLKKLIKIKSYLNKSET